MSTTREGACWLGFDLGGTKMHAALFGPDGEVLARKRRKTRGQEGAEAGVKRVADTIEKLIAEANLTGTELGGIGIGIPGPIELDTGIIRESPNLGWKQVPLKKLLEHRFGVPVILCNDVDAGVYGEYVAGAAVGARAVIGIFPGTGIGAGMIYEGKIYRGKQLSCLEVGHMPVRADGARCGCGRRGCLETVASRLAMSAEAAKAAYRGQAPHLLHIAGTDLANIRSGALAEAIEAGDKIIDQIVRDGARAMGVVMGGVVNLLAPDVIILGGGLVEAMPKLFVEEVSHGIRDHTMPAFAEAYTLKVAGLGDNAGVVGCARWAEYCVKNGLAEAILSEGAKPPAPPVATV